MFHYDQQVPLVGITVIVSLCRQDDVSELPPMGPQIWASKTTVE